MVQKPLKIVHLTTFVNGGAGIAGYRIHEALLKRNIDSVFLATDKPLFPNPQAFIQIKNPPKPLWQRAVAKFWRIVPGFINVRLFNKRAYYRHELKKIKSLLKSEPPSLPFSNYDIMQHAAVQRADIIHLHWVSGLLDYPSFFRNNEKTVVWTFHDMNTFKGLFHYEGDEIRNKNIAGDLDKEIVELKRNITRQLANKMTIVAPSKWLFNEAAKSDMFDSKATFKKIFYSVDIDTFTPREADSLRTELQIPADHTVLLFVSQSVHNHRKGFDMLSEAVSKLDHSKITLITIGYLEDNQFASFSCIHIGYIYDNRLLSRYYSLADAFIIPSREDNLPNIMLEALCCGTPIVSFNVGGMAEIIEDGFNGLKSPEMSSNSLQKTIEMFIEKNHEFDRKKIRERAVSLFSPGTIADQYMEVYKELLN
jgi:glycosyltransferase involved in cell wall biosynthesis